MTTIINAAAERIGGPSPQSAVSAELLDVRAVVGQREGQGPRNSTGCLAPVLRQAATSSRSKKKSENKRKLALLSSAP